MSENNKISEIDVIGTGTLIYEGLEVLLSNEQNDGRGIRIGSQCIIYPRNRFVLGDLGINKKADLEIGNHVLINSGSYISGEGGVKIGDYTLIGPNTCIISAGHCYNDLDTSIQDQPLSYGKIVIGKDVWIGASSVILQNVTIHDGAVIGAGSVVCKDVPPGAVVVGNPGEIIKFRGTQEIHPPKYDEPETNTHNKKDAKYHVEINLNEENRSHTKLLKMLGREKYVLELGCFSGYMTQYMKEHLNCRVFGIEMDKNSADLAKPYCEELVIGNLEEMNLIDTIGERRFDVILLADIIEHLKDPFSLLATVKHFLTKKGYILLSVPNAVHGSMGLELIDGRWKYRSYGLFDDTHLRYFDKNGLHQLLDRCGFVISRFDRVLIHPKDTEIKTKWGNYPKEITEYIERVNPEFQTYQFVLKAFPATEKGIRARYEDQINVLQSETRRLENEKNKYRHDFEQLQLDYVNIFADLQKIKIENNDAIQCLEDNNKTEISNLLEKNAALESIVLQTSNELKHCQAIIHRITSHAAYRVYRKIKDFLKG